MERLFGTDGIRGVANADLSCELALKIARAAAQVLMKKTTKKPKVIIGADTRASGDMLCSAMASGFASAGADVVLLGVVPTPAVSYLAKLYKADIGVVISASHNPAKYNGIKLFNGQGYKLADEIEDEIENLIFNGQANVHETPGYIIQKSDATQDYVEYLLKSENATNLDGLKVVIDCANGASSNTANYLFNELGANVEIINNEPNGLNINKGCGSTHIDEISKAVIEYKADIGISFDGDADRCLAVDQNGEIIDGDRIIAALAIDMKSRGKLKKNTVVVTTLSNMGFTKTMRDNGIEVLATRVGDRYVLEEMKKEGLSLGGEQSGHVILLDINTTGDGQLTALSILSLLKRNNKKASYITDLVKSFPQIQSNISADNEQKSFLAEDIIFNGEVSKAASELGENGRVLVRPSGTEPLVRIMVEGIDLIIVERIAGHLTNIANKRIQS